ncbi:MAG: hypothetical protein DRI80_04140 [Chloroflexota bacterium]|nr:MAG: hypothetical protein DRI80_04140 [Chloroflexota bacterium]
MNAEVQGYRNMILYAEFEQYLLEHPELDKQIPDGTSVVFMPEDDPELCQANRALLNQAKREGRKVVIIRVKGLAPARSRLIEPRAELVAA